MGNNTKRYTDLADYCERNPHLKEWWIAKEQLGGMNVARFSKLKSRKYGIRPNEDESALLAALLNRTVSYVDHLYRRAA